MDRMRQGEWELNLSITNHKLRSPCSFELAPGANKTLTVSDDWQGRLWGRTNCTFDSSGRNSGGNPRACSSGDCGGNIQCRGTGEVPVTLAEFTLHGSDRQAFYDISLVDGYNLPMAIVVLTNGYGDLEDLEPNETNPSCVASIGDFHTNDPYANSATFLGTTSQQPFPFANDVSSSDVSSWCPWDLQVNPPEKPGDGVYPYPDTGIERPPFNPCLSACARYNKPQYCCQGDYDDPSVCGANYYSRAAKNVCPDAYSFAYDDQDSTFIIPHGAGFQVVFCPSGRSTDIIATGKASVAGGSGSGSGPQTSGNGRKRSLRERWLGW